MSPRDLLGFTSLTLARQRFRSLMLVLSLALGVSSVAILVALGEAARGYVLQEFALLGTDVLAVFPGRKSTSGAMPPVSGTAARDLTLDDARWVARGLPGVRAVVPLVQGSAGVSFSGRERESLVIGSSSAFFAVRRLQLGAGSIWSGVALDQASPVAVIGETVRDELFGQGRALGQWLRVRDYRFRVVGILEGSGDSFGADLGDAIFIPVASAQQLFNVSCLFRLLVQVDPGRDREKMIVSIEQRLMAARDGQLDVTVVNPDAMLSSLSDILLAMTLAVAGIAAISLVVAGILVMNLTLISVQQRTAEIGLLKAVGATSGQVRLIFIAEALVLAAVGISVGFALALIVLQAAAWAIPDLPFSLPWWALLAVGVITVIIALIFAWRPSSRAAALTPVAALGRGL